LEGEGGWRVKKHAKFIESIGTKFFFFLNGKIYYIYKGIKSQVLNQKQKMKTPKTPKEKPPTPLKC